MTKTKFSCWRSSLGGVLVVCAVLPAALVNAQTADHGGGGDDYTPRGARLGGFLLYPKLVLEESYDDNIYTANTNETDDFITKVTPSLNLRSDWNRHSLRFDAKADIVRYLDQDPDDYEDYDLRARGRADASKAMKISADARYRLLHEERGSDDVASDASAPVEYSRANGELKAEYKPNRFGLTIGTTLNEYDYDDNQTIGGGTTNNDDRDRTQWTALLRAGYEIQDGYEAYLNAAYNDRNYDDAVDDNGFNRDSDGYKIQAGLAVDLTRLIRADVGLGWMEQDYTDVQLKDASGWSADGRVRWNVTQLTALRATLSRAINETTSTDVSSTLVTTVGVGVDHEFLRNLIAKADISNANSDYQGTTRKDDKLTLSAGVDYKVNRNFFGGLKYTYEDRDSNINTNNYSNNIVKLTVGAQF